MIWWKMKSNLEKKKNNIGCKRRKKDEENDSRKRVEIQ